MYPEAQILIEQEDRQDIDVPILAKQEERVHSYY